MRGVVVMVVDIITYALKTTPRNTSLHSSVVGVSLLNSTRVSRPRLSCSNIRLRVGRGLVCDAILKTPKNHAFRPSADRRAINSRYYRAADKITAGFTELSCLYLSLLRVLRWVPRLIPRRPLILPRDKCSVTRVTTTLPPRPLRQTQAVVVPIQYVGS